VLIIPRQHIATVNALESGDAQLVGELFLAAKQIARQEGVAERGYRLTMNCNAAAGQTVFHLHLHLLGGRDLGWPPG
jgi:histidine triad (HIT) family protein